MIKIYFDWNVLSQIKNGKHSELKQLIQDNEKLLIPFSTSHINDLSSNFKNTSEEKEYINSDLEFISKTTKEYCLFNNGKGIVLDFYPPKELFEQNISDKDTFSDLSIDGLMKNFEDDELTNRLVKPIFDLLKSFPIGESFKQAFENPESSEIMDKMFPGLKENPTMDGFFKSFSKMNFNLNELDSYKGLRQTVQSSTNINRNKIFDTENPYDLIEKSYKKLGISLDQLKQESKHSPQWFDDITNEYLKLDIHGYQEDKVNIKKGRKETFKNTTDDAFHASFASTCSFYVINDNKSYKKTKKVYEKLNINTRVFKPDEFTDFYKKFLNYNNPILDLKIMEDILNSENFHKSKTDDGIYKTYYFPYFLFDFFNKIICFFPKDESKEASIILSQDKPTNWFIIPKEVDILLKKLLIYFGTDLKKEGKLKPNEFNNEKWNGRKWEFENFILSIKAINGFVQLYWDTNKEKANR
ncbi:hypothetical protein [Tenacibaculum finnmarkense]|uniref:hypothetical protein n=1 Tax=Tenacibaculum finnmarkense TaxID=2781243 RepID=UPI00187BB233|nr:hypothetical protein [Tenacibaculum finnmarkense]MBE7649176.1 hypothetical protein [Tenacibaculum finnmarkense genomovar ulcerans]